MTKDTLFKLHQEVCSGALELLKAKNHDYASESNVFGNLELVESLSHDTISTEEGILIRAGDKLSRLFNAARGTVLLVREKPEDNVRDVINYMVLLLAKMIDRTEGTAPPPPAIRPPPPLVPDNPSTIPRRP